MFGFGETPRHAISLLTADHRKVEQLFAEFERAEESARKVELATQICNELTVHATVEEELFYPQLMAAFQSEDKDEDVDLIWEATVEHGTLEGLISALTGMRAADDGFEAHVKVLKEYVKHHVREEENEMFPKARRTSIDLDALGEAMEKRKLQLQQQMGLAPLSRGEEEASDESAGRRGSKRAARGARQGGGARTGSGGSRGKRGGEQRRAS
jgi:hemerythrin superfamily protein